MSVYEFSYVPNLLRQEQSDSEALLDRFNKAQIRITECATMNQTVLETVPHSPRTIIPDFRHICNALHAISYRYALHECIGNMSYDAAAKKCKSFFDVVSW